MFIIYDCKDFILSHFKFDNSNFVVAMKASRPTEVHARFQ